MIDLPGYTGDPGYVGFDITETRQDLQRRLSDWATRMVPTGIEVETLVECGIGSDSITSVARNRAADLIVITTHGYTGLKHVLLGSTAERVVRTAPCPVFVVREKQHELI